MEIDVTSKHRLEWCKVHLKPSRDMDLEYFSSPAALISFLNVDFEHDKQVCMLGKWKNGRFYAKHVDIKLSDVFVILNMEEYFSRE